MRTRALLAVVALVLVAATVFVYLYSGTKTNNILTASGTIEATDVDVSFQIAGRVSEVLAIEGQPVKSGQLVARLVADDLVERVRQIEAALDAASSQSRQQRASIDLRRGVIEGQVLQARHQEEAARLGMQRLKDGLRPQEVRVAEADLAQTEAQLAQKRADFERATQLFADEVIPKQQMDVAEASLKTAEAVHNAATQRLALAREGTRHEDIAEAEARLRAAQAASTVAEAGRKEIDVLRATLETARAQERQLSAELDTAKTLLGRAEIHSPIDGVVLTKNVESGEVVSPGTPVVTIANIDELWMNIYIPETQTGALRLGQEVTIRVDAFPNESFKGQVTFISSESEFTPKTILTPEERIKLVFRAKITVNDSQRRLKPGMPADAEIQMEL